MMNRTLRRALGFAGVVVGVIALGIYGALADTSTVLTEYVSQSVKMVQYSWTSNGVGTASGPTLEVYNGRVMCAVQIPSDGATEPDTLYDVVVTTSLGDDVLANLGANLDDSLSTYKNEKDGLGCVGNSVLTLSVTNAGANNTGKTILYIR